MRRQPARSVVGFHPVAGSAAAGAAAAHLRQGLPVAPAPNGDQPLHADRSRRLPARPGRLLRRFRIRPVAHE